MLKSNQLIPTVLPSLKKSAIFVENQIL